MRAYFILYVADQNRSRDFYRKVLDMEPRLDVPGMTEFDLGIDSVLGLMPAAGIRRLLGDAIPDPSAAAGLPRAELYLFVNNLDSRFRCAIDNGARALSPPALRSWGHMVAYCLDPDGHVLAFAMIDTNLNRIDS